MLTEKCIGCSIETEKLDGPTHRYLGSSPGCWSRFGEVLAREYQNFEYMAVHELTVDAYALQHAGQESPQTLTSAYVHLGSLYSYFELGTPTGELTQIRQRLTEKKNEFTWLQPPATMDRITVLDVLSAGSPAEHRELVSMWAAYVYECWQSHHVQISRIVALIRA